jgi:hypothetical protein
MNDALLWMKSSEGSGRFQAAYEQVLPELIAFPESELVTINLDVPTAATTAIGAWPEMSTFREQVKTLPGFDVAAFDKLEVYALAAVHAHGQFVAASTPAVPLPELAERALAARELLLSDATALAKRGLVNGERLKELKGPQGYRNIAIDIVVLDALFKERWAVIASKTALTSAELAAAVKVADDLVTAIGQREQAPVVVTVATDYRQRAFSLLVRAYDQARRAIGFLRWDKGDLEDIAPSLYAGRVGPKSRKAMENDAKSDAAPVAASVAAPSGEPATSLHAAPAMGPVQPTTAAKGPLGFPGNDPFNK